MEGIGPEVIGTGWKGRIPTGIKLRPTCDVTVSLPDEFQGMSFVSSLYRFIFFPFVKLLDA